MPFGLEGESLKESGSQATLCLPSGSQKCQMALGPLLRTVGMAFGALDLVLGGCVQDTMTVNRISILVGGSWSLCVYLCLCLSTTPDSLWRSSRSNLCLDVCVYIARVSRRWDTSCLSMGFSTDSEPVLPSTRFKHQSACQTAQSCTNRQSLENDALSRR